MIQTMSKIPFIGALFLCATALVAQNAAPEARFALEVPNPNGNAPQYLTVQEPPSGRQVSFWYGQYLLPVAGWSSQAPQPSALKLAYKVEGDTVVMEASVFFGAFDGNDTPRSIEGLREQKLGTYSARLSESVTLRELEQFGVQPLTIGVVTARPPAPVRPVIVNKVPSLQVDVIGEEWTAFKLAARNVSGRAVTSLRLDREGRVESTGSEEGALSTPLMAAGASRDFQLYSPMGGKMTPSGFVADPYPPVITVQAALFDDGSFEGDAVAAAIMTARRAARSAQRQRTSELIAAVLQDTTSDDATKLARIRSDVQQLPKEPDQTLLDQVRSRFPNLPDTAGDSINAAIRSGLLGQAEFVLTGLREFERTHNRPTLAAWWAAWKNNE